MNAAKRALMVVAILAGMFAVVVGVPSIGQPARSKSVATCPLTYTVIGDPIVRVRFGICLPPQ